MLYELGTIALRTITPGTIDTSHANAHVIVQNHGLVLKGSDCKTTDTLKINNRVNSTKDILTLFKPHDQGSRDGNEGPVPSRSKGVTN